MSIGQPFPRSDPGDSNHRTRRSAELRETVEMLDQGAPDIARGRDNEQTLGISTFESQAMVGQFPKIQPAKPLSGARDVGATIARLGDQVENGVEPRVHVDPANGQIHRVHGTMLPALEEAWKVYHRGKNQWRAVGGTWSYYPEGVYADPVSFTVKTLDFTGQFGWVVLVAKGSLVNPAIEDRYFVITRLYYEFRSILAGGIGLKSDFQSIHTASSVTQSCSYGHFPVAFISSPGFKTAAPLILHRRAKYLPPGCFGSPCIPSQHFARWNN